jgi:hypothetical protein
VKTANEWSSILCGFGIPESVVFFFFFLINEVKCTECKNKQRGGVSHCGLAIYIKKCLKAKKKRNYENSNISPCKNIVFTKSS